MVKKQLNRPRQKRKENRFVVLSKNSLNWENHHCGKNVENLSMNHSKIWEKSKERIKTSQPLHAYSTWFDPIRSIGLSENELVLEVPNQFFFEWIQSHYKQIIKDDSVYFSFNCLFLLYCLFLFGFFSFKLLSVSFFLPSGETVYFILICPL